MERSPKDLVAQAAAQRAEAQAMLQRAMSGESPLPGYGAEAAADLLRENISTYDEMIRRNV